MSEPERQLPPGPSLTGWKGLLAIALTIPAMFWLGYGEIDEYALGFTAFLVMIAAALEYLPAFSVKAEKQQSKPQAPYIPGPFDALGIVWLLSIPFAPFLTWIMRNTVGVNASNWESVLGLSAFFCVLVPLVCVLPMLRFVNRGNARVAIAILGIGTAFPVLTGLGSAYDVVRGPEWQSVEVVRLIDLDRTTNKGTRIQAEAIKVVLADGRTLSRAPNARVQTGPARLLVLRGVKRIIAAQQ